MHDALDTYVMLHYFFLRFFLSLATHTNTHTYIRVVIICMEKSARTRKINIFISFGVSVCVCILNTIITQSTCTPTIMCNDDHIFGACMEFFRIVMISRVYMCGIIITIVTQIHTHTQTNTHKCMFTNNH